MKNAVAAVVLISMLAAITLVHSADKPGIISDIGQPAREIVQLKRQIDLLHQALAPLTPQEAADKWAKAMKLRNGALQNAVLSPQLRQEYYPIYSERGWIIGTSSPWVSSYQITDEDEIDQNNQVVTIEFSLETSTGPAGTQIFELTVTRCEDYWLVSAIKLKDGRVAKRFSVNVARHALFACSQTVWHTNCGKK